MLQAEYRIEKSRIARSFAQAAQSYDAYAALQRSVAESLLAKLSPDSSAVRVLDLGSGTGYSTAKLKAAFTAADIISLDIAEGMLHYAREQHAGQDLDENFICADAESLPLVSGSIDVIFSSLSIQWCQNYSRLFAELQRVLRPGGRLVLASFGPGTLRELEQAWRQVDGFVHVNRFQSDTDLLAALHTNGFRNVQVENETRQVHYRNFDALARELKAIGAHNMNAGQGRGLGGRRKITMLRKVFEENYAEPHGIPVTYEVQYLSAVLA